MDISLALGGGGSRGYAHLGVIRYLEKQGFRIRAVAGTSAGGIIAGLYAAGHSPEEMEQQFRKIDQSKLFSIALSEGPGLLSLSYASRLLEEYLGERTFADLRIPCAMVAVDLKSNREIILREGRVVDAILATCAVPGVFPPKILGEHELVDGGVLDPVPVSVARSLDPDLPVVAVVLSSRVEQPAHMGLIPLPVKIPAPIVDRLTRLRVAHVFKVFEQSVELGTRLITELRLEVDEPAVVIRPEVGVFGLFERVDVSEVVGLGEKAAMAALPDLQRAVRWSRRLGRQLFPPGVRREKKARPG